MGFAIAATVFYFFSLAVLGSVILRQRRIIAVQDKILAGEFLIEINGTMHIARPINAVRYTVSHAVEGWPI